MTNGEIKGVIPCHRGNFNLDGTLFAGSHNGFIEVRNTETLKILNQLPVPTNQLPYSVAFNADNSRLLALHMQPIQRLWDLKHSKLIRTFGYGNPHLEILSPDLTMSLRMQKDNSNSSTIISLEMLETGKKYSQTFNQRKLNVVKFCTANHCLFLGGHAEKSVLINTDDGSIIRTGFNNYFIKDEVDIQFSSDGQFLMLQTIIDRYSEGPADIWRILPCSPQKTPLQDMLALLVLQNNRKHEQPLCAASLTILKKSKEGYLQNYAQSLDPSAASATLDLTLPAPSLDQLLAREDRCVVQ
jgi:hypothetical protein